MALSAVPSSLSFASPSASAQTVTLSGGTAPYVVFSNLPGSLVTASISGTTLTVTPVAAGSATVTVHDSAGTPLSIAIVATVAAALVVKINTRIVSPSLGVIQSDNASYYDPITGVNLNRGNPTSGSLSGFTSLQLANIANAVDSGILSVVSGSLPAAATQSFALYSTVFKNGPVNGTTSTTPINGPAPGSGSSNPASPEVFTNAGSQYAGSGVAAADALEPLNVTFPANPAV